MKKTKPRATKKEEMTSMYSDNQKTLYKSILALWEDYERDLQVLDCKRQYLNELDKLERRYRNDRICFWIGLLLFGIMIVDVIFLIAKTF